jgi:ParB-like chromosome segregation protein Spo0J
MFCCRSLEQEEIKAEVQPPMSDVDALSMNLKENLLRAQLNIVQEAKAIARMRNLGVGEVETANLIGQSRGWVQIRFMLLSLPKDIYPDVVAGLINQTNIRELYTTLRRGGPQAALEQAREMKSAKQRGLKDHQVQSKETRLNAKRHRKRPEIFEMQSHIQNNLGNSFATRCLAWAAGEISTKELENDIKARCDSKGLEYKEMESLIPEEETTF